MLREDRFKFGGNLHDEFVSEPDISRLLSNTSKQDIQSSKQLSELQFSRSFRNCDLINEALESNDMFRNIQV